MPGKSRGKAPSKPRTSAMMLLWRRRTRASFDMVTPLAGPAPAERRVECAAARPRLLAGRHGLQPGRPPGYWDSTRQGNRPGPAARSLVVVSGLPDLYAQPNNPGAEGLGVWCTMST